MIDPADPIATTPGVTHGRILPNEGNRFGPFSLARIGGKSMLFHPVQKRWIPLPGNQAVADTYLSDAPSPRIDLTCPKIVQREGQLFKTQDGSLHRLVPGTGWESVNSSGLHRTLFGWSAGVLPQNPGAQTRPPSV